tara:strand:- start:186 stop:353 length:168 start_codon:yes stop_codon:yes gene_type:complete
MNTESTHRMRLRLQRRLIVVTNKWFNSNESGKEFFNDQMNLLEKEILILRKEKIN